MQESSFELLSGNHHSGMQSCQMVIELDVTDCEFVVEYECGREAQRDRRYSTHYSC